MILRAMLLALGLTGAFGAAQFPAFSQQYLQRLGGAVDALEQVVADFDASAATLGLNREQALAQMSGSAFVEHRRADMKRTFARYTQLRGDLAALQGLGPFMRAYHVPRMRDAEIARGALAAFRPALPLDMTTVLFALSGFAGTRLILWFLIMCLPRRRRRPMTA